jgi:hypothetical protein
VFLFTPPAGGAKSRLRRLHYGPKIARLSGFLKRGGGDGDGGDDSGRPTRERGKRKKRESKDARRRHAAKGR